MSKELTEPEIRSVQEAIVRKHILSDEQREVADTAMSIAAREVGEWTIHKKLRDEFAMSAASGLISGGFFSLLLQMEMTKDSNKAIQDAAVIAAGGVAGVSYKIADEMLKARNQQ